MFNSFAKIAFAAILITTIASCEKRSCKNIVCPIGEECSSGYCVCLNGYEGANCDTLSYPKYLGTYYATETCINSPTGAPYNFSSYTVGVYSDTTYNVNYIFFFPLFDLGKGIAFIYNTPGNLGNNISVPAQTVGTVQVQQSYGNFYPATSANKASMLITFNYTYEGIAYTCEQTFLKQN